MDPAEISRISRTAFTEVFRSAWITATRKLGRRPRFSADPRFPAVQLLDQRRLGDHRSLRAQFSVALALLFGRALARGDLVERAPLRLHPQLGVAREHGARDVPGDTHDHLVASARLREFRDQCVAIVVPPADDFRVVAYL